METTGWDMNKKAFRCTNYQSIIAPFLVPEIIEKKKRKKSKTLENSELKVNLARRRIESDNRLVNFGQILSALKVDLRIIKRFQIKMDIGAKWEDAIQYAFRGYPKQYRTFLQAVLYDPSEESISRIVNKPK